MSDPLFQSIIGTVVAAILSAMVFAILRGITTLRDNTRAITELRGDMQRWRETNEQMSREIADLQSWRNSITASLFSMLGSKDG